MLTSRSCGKNIHFSKVVKGSSVDFKTCYMDVQHFNLLLLWQLDLWNEVIQKQQGWGIQGIKEDQTKR